MTLGENSAVRLKKVTNWHKILSRLNVKGAIKLPLALEITLASTINTSTYNASAVT